MKTITVVALMRILGEERRSIVHRVETHEMDFGAHYGWNGQDPTYTAAGLRLIADAFDVIEDTKGAYLCRLNAVALEEKPAEQPTPPPVVAVTPENEPGEAEFLAKRWDLKEANR